VNVGEAVRVGVADERKQIGSDDDSPSLPGRNPQPTEVGIAVGV